MHKIVVCPEINDNEILEKSIQDLSRFWSKEKQTVLSVAIVPVGLTRFRPEDDGLIAIDKSYAKKTIIQVENIQEIMQKKLGTRFLSLIHI